MKDLNCTHMTFEKHSTKWCYCCGRSSQEIGEFEELNQWTLQTSPGEDRCPMYLHYKYSDTICGTVMNGDPEKALKQFHLEMQKEAVMNHDS
jgi:hypothetical protein